MKGEQGDGVKIGVCRGVSEKKWVWIPAFAGMTGLGDGDDGWVVAPEPVKEY
jgi:hypothetical protein